MQRTGVYLLTPDARLFIRRHIEREMREGETHFSNGRFVRNLIEKAIRKQATRLLDGRRGLLK